MPSRPYRLMSRADRSRMQVFVGNLPFSVTGESIKEIFAKVGTV